MLERMDLQYDTGNESYHRQFISTFYNGITVQGIFSCLN